MNVVFQTQSDNRWAEVYQRGSGGLGGGVEGEFLTSRFFVHLTSKQVSYICPEAEYSENFVTFLHLFSLCVPLALLLKGKAVSLQAWTGPEGFRNLRLPDFMTTAQNGGRLSALAPAAFTPRKYSWYYFC